MEASAWIPNLCDPWPETGVSMVANGEKVLFFAKGGDKVNHMKAAARQVAREAMVHNYTQPGSNWRPSAC